MSEARRPRTLHVVAGIMRAADGRVLLAQRPAGKHLAGGWEFPGGKLEAGEGRRDGLCRELREELGVTLVAARPFMRLSHSYPDRSVDLDAWLVTAWRGEPRGCDGQALRWCAAAELAGAGLLPADAPIARALLLPERIVEAEARGYVVGTPGEHPAANPNGPHVADPVRLRGVLCHGPTDVAAAVALRADFIVMRCALPDDALSALCASSPVPVYAYGVTLSRACALGAHGVSELAG